MRVPNVDREVGCYMEWAKDNKGLDLCTEFIKSSWIQHLFLSTAKGLRFLRKCFYAVIINLFLNHK